MLSKLKKKLSKSKHIDNYNHLNKDTSRIALSNYDVLAYNLYYVEPTREFKLVLIRHRFWNDYTKIGTTKYYDTHILIGQYLQFQGQLYTQESYRELMYRLNKNLIKKEERKNNLDKKMKSIKFFLKHKKISWFKRRIIKLKEKINRNNY